jgi:hypothetical protein
MPEGFIPGKRYVWREAETHTPGYPFLAAGSEQSH